MDLETAYLAQSAAGALNTLNAWKPLTSNDRLSSLCFFPGWLTSELPLQTLAAQVGIAGAVGLAGGLGSAKGRLGLAFTAASAVGLMALHRSGAASAEVLEAALVDGLGAGYRNRMHPDYAPPADVPLTKLQVASPVRLMRTKYGADRNIPYGPAGKRNLLDVWRRSDLRVDGKAPVLLQVHGGGWVIGEKEQQGGPLMGHLCERGWVCAAINYPLSPKATWPDHIVEVKRALAWVKANIHRYGGDPSFVVITGGSAGGHLCSLAALSANEPMFQPGFEDADTTVQACVPFYGVYDWLNRDGTGNSSMDDFIARVIIKKTRQEAPEVWDRASTMSWVGPDAPPFFVLHGTNDSLVPVAQARSFVSMLRAASTSPVVFAELPRTQHAFEVFASVRAQHAVRAVDRFLAVVRSERHAPAMQAAATA